MNPLICSPSPRDIPDFLNAISKIPCDRLFAKYYSEPEAYKILRDFFLSNTEYTHMIICPDDLIVTRKDYEILTKDIEELDFPVLGGISTMDYYSKEYTAALVLDPHKRFTYEELFNGKHIKKVEFDGLAFTFIRRDIVKKIELHGDENGGRFDNAFALECRNRGIPMHVDVRANMIHLANRIGTHENMRLGRKTPYIRFEQYFC